MTIEQLAKQIFDECAKDGEPVTVEESIEMAKMEIGAKGFKHDAKSVETIEKKDRKPKTVKISDEKKALFAYLTDCLETFYGENVQIVKENKEFSLQINEKSFKIDVIEHKKKK